MHIVHIDYYTPIETPPIYQESYQHTSLDGFWSTCKNRIWLTQLVEECERNEYNEVTHVSCQFYTFNCKTNKVERHTIEPISAYEWFTLMNSYAQTHELYQAHTKNVFNATTLQASIAPFDTPHALHDASQHGNPRYVKQWACYNHYIEDMLHDLIHDLHRAQAQQDDEQFLDTTREILRFLNEQQAIDKRYKTRQHPNPYAHDMAHIVENIVDDQNPNDIHYDDTLEQIGTAFQTIDIKKPTRYLEEQS